MEKLLKTKDENISTKLYKILKEDIYKNDWKENSKFHSIRQISIKYSINLNTVLKVFQELEKDGYLYSIKGKGCFIKKGLNLKVRKEMIPILNTFSSGQNKKCGEINLSNGAPPSQYFPISEYKKIMSNIWEDTENIEELLGYQDIQGLKSLRNVLVKNLKTYSISTDEDSIIMCSGTQIILQLIFSTFGFSPKKNLLISEPTYQNTIESARRVCNIETIDLKEDGWDMLEFENMLKIKKIHFIYVMSNFQNPTGVSWSLKKKEKLLDLAEKYDFFIIEDDCFIDFYYDSKIPIPLKALDKNDRVFYVKTFSKIVMPSISLAMLIPPKKYIESISLNKYLIDTTTSGINQKFLEIFIKDNHLKNHLENLRNIFSNKMSFVLNQLKTIEHLKILSIPKGGFFVWLELASYINEEAFYNKCCKNGISILPGFIFYPNKKNFSRIRISVVSASLAELETSLKIIKKLTDECNLCKLINR